jgi:CubicO group peptidase (beta-lactamase class C family)
VKASFFITFKFQKSTKMKFNLGLLSLFCCPFLTLHAQQNFPIDPVLKQKIDSTYESLIKKNKVVGTSIAIVDKNGIIYANGYGFADKENQQKANENTVYRIGSVSKILTNLGIQKLVQNKLMYLDDPLSAHLTDLKVPSRFDDGNELSISEVMSHTSGLPSDLLNGFFCDNPPSMEWVIQQLNRTGTTYPRQYVWSYSNVGYGLLGEVLSRKSKSTYDQFMRDSIFVPLGMKSSFVRPIEIEKSLLAKGYINKGKLFEEPLIRDEAAGLVHSSVLDMSRVVQLFLNEGHINSNQFLDSNLMNQLWMSGYLVDLQVQPSFNYGLGLFIEETFLQQEKDTIPVRYISHGGDTYAFHADFGFVPELGLGVVVLTNSDEGRSMNEAKKLLNTYLKWHNKTTVLKPQDVMKDLAETRFSFNIATNTEKIPGTYNAGQFLLEMKSSNKGSFKQGPIKIVVKGIKNKPARFHVYVRLLGIFKIKIPNQEIQFTSENGEMLVRGVNHKELQWSYLSKKQLPQDLSPVWKSKVGKYVVDGDKFPCAKCEEINMNFSDFKLSVKGKYVVVSAKGSKKGPTTTLYFEQLNDNTLICGGIGRGMGEAIHLLPNGRLFYQGFELSPSNR